MGEETGGNITLYIYDASGAPIGMQYHGSNYGVREWDVYWYEKNLQGDIIAVYDETGTKMVSYQYDAWGALCIETLSSSAAGTAAVNNPFRYRGYYYDADLGMYYLQSRYYDQNIGRFINADSYVSTGQGMLSYNTYCYCMNNPVMFIDQNGELPKFLQWIVDLGHNIEDAILGSVEAEVGLGIGLDVNETGAYRDVYVGIDDKKLETGNVIEVGIGNEDGGISYSADYLSEKDGEKVGQSGSADDNILSMLSYPDTTHTISTKSSHFSISSKGDVLLTASTSGHIILGGHARISVNITDLFRRLFD